MYGSCSVLVMALGGQVNGYTLDPNIGEFVLTHKKMTIGSKKIYSLNEGYSHSFSPAIKGYLDSLKNPPVGHVGKFSPYSARYVGSMVADVLKINTDASNTLVRRCIFISIGKASNAVRMFPHGYDY